MGHTHIIILVIFPWLLYLLQSGKKCFIIMIVFITFVIYWIDTDNHLTFGL